MGLFPRHPQKACSVKHPLIACAALLLAASTALQAAEQRAEKPNIVFIFGDDMGWSDVGYNGAEFPTPNIDRMAREGVKLDVRSRENDAVWPSL